MRSLARRALVVLVCTLCVLLFAAGDTPPGRTQAWSPRVIELFGSLPVQDGGRIKPLSTLAGFTLLRLHGTRSAKSLGGQPLEAMDWLLDVLFFPEDAARADTFLVQDSDAITAIGLQIRGKRKRDRWSYEELQPGIQKLLALAHDYDAIPEKERDSVQQQIVQLAEHVWTFVRLARELDCVRGDADPGFGRGLLALLPPGAHAAGTEEWRTAAETALVPTRSAEDSGVLDSLRTLVARRSEPDAFERELERLHADLVARAAARDEYGSIALERFYYGSRMLAWGLGAFVAAFLTAAVLWLRPRDRRLYALTWTCAAAGVAILIAAITVRCLIRGRPPVSTLYESVLFVTAVGGSLALFLEAIHRNRIGVSAVAVLGVIGLFIANGYETLDKQDTMPSLVAVLDTNFWLATHVTAITIGYSAGLLAALLANAYLLTKLVRAKRRDPAFHRSLARMVYGVLCFAVIFSTVGTILGGIWANESWGRFWGWDPKENGALLIVITELAILHARQAGWLRERGTCLAAALLGSVIAFSWWGVNLLGVGLHSYGFTSGVHTALWTYYATQWGVVALGGVALWRERTALAKEGRVPAAESVEPKDPFSPRSNTRETGVAA